MGTVANEDNELKKIREDPRKNREENSVRILQEVAPKQNTLIGKYLESVLELSCYPRLMRIFILNNWQM